MNNKTSNNTERLKQLAKELRESNEIKRFYGNNFTEGSKYCVVSEAELIPTAEAIEEVLAELEQKDKRIQELKEESEILEFQNKQVENYAEELKRYNKTVSDRIVEYKKNSIPKQDIIDKIEELKNDLKYIDCNRDCSKCFNKEGKALYRGSDFNFCYAYYQIKALQELLEGEK